MRWGLKWLLIFLAVTLHADPFPAMTIMQDVHREFDYVKSPGDLKLPSETRADGEGDCADLSLVMIERMEAVGMSGAVISFWDHWHLGSHSVVEFKGRLYDPANDIIWDPGPGWAYRTHRSYANALWMAAEE